MVLDLLTGAGALGVGAFMLWDHGRAHGARSKKSGFVAAGLLLLLGAGLLAAAGLLLWGSTWGRLASLEAAVLFSGWVGSQLVLRGKLHWLHAVTLVVGAALVVLSFLLPAPG